MAIIGFSLLMLFVVIIFVGVIFWAKRGIRLRRDLIERGKHTTATVIDVSPVRYKGRTIVAYIYTLEYTADGERHTGKCSTKMEMSKGDTAEVAYLPENPKRFTFAGELADTFGNKAEYPIIAAVGVAGIIGMVFIFYGFLVSQASPDEFVKLCNDGSPWQIKLMIKVGADVGADNNRALMEAARYNNNPEVLNVLIQAGADVGAKDSAGRTVLMLAAMNNSAEVVNVLIKAELDINANDNGGNTPLMVAAQSNNNPEALNVLIQAGADVNAKNIKGETALMLATERSNNPEVLNILIQAGADVNAKNNEGGTTLRVAAEKSRPEIVSLLLAAGAGVSGSDVELAQKNFRLENTAVIEELLAVLSARNPVFIELCKSGAPQEIEAAIREGADVNAKDDEGRTVLSLAVETREPEVVSLLLATGAVVSESDLELAQRNERLRDTAVIEDLKTRYAKAQQEIRLNADRQRIVGAWETSDSARTDIYTFKRGNTVELEIMATLPILNVKTHDTYGGKYHISDDVLHIENSTVKHSRNGVVTWRSHKTQAQYRYSFGEDENGEYLELTRISFVGTDGKTEGPSDKGTKYYRKK